MENSKITLNASDSKIYYSGRFHSYSNGEVSGNWAGISVTVKFIGTSLKVIMDANDNYFNIILNDQVISVIDCEHDTSGIYTIIENLEHKEHEVTIFKRTEAISGSVCFKKFTIVGEKYLTVEKIYSSKIEFIGDSITAGYGIEDSNKNNGYNHSTSNNYLAYGCITARLMNAEYRTVAHSGKGVYQNYEQDTFETIPKIYKNILMHQDIPVDTSIWIPDYIVINLGTNDFAIQPPIAIQFLQTYYNFLLDLSHLYPHSKIICTVGPTLNDSWPVDPCTGESYQSLTLCKKLVNQTVHFANDNDLTNIHFFELSNRSEEFGFGADFHPSIKQSEANAQELYDFIKSLK